jgi:hypothetical protein
MPQIRRFYSENVGQKLGELINSAGQVLCTRQKLGFVGKQVQVEHSQHRPAGSGRDYHIGFPIQGVQRPDGQLPGVLGKAGIVQGLATTGLVWRKIHIYAATS